MTHFASSFVLFPSTGTYEINSEFFVTDTGASKPHSSIKAYNA